MTYGWPAEMIVKAARLGARVVEVPVSYHPRRAGRSKVSGTVRGTLLAAWHILLVTLRSRLIFRVPSPLVQEISGGKHLHGVNSSQGSGRRRRLLGSGIAAATIQFFLQGPCGGGKRPRHFGAFPVKVCQCPKR